MKYINNFENHTKYEDYLVGSEFPETEGIPTVSFCELENEVHYDKYVETRVVAKYYTDIDDSTITLFKSQGGSESGESPFSAMKIDGVEQPEVVNEYTFSTAGEHTVKYTLTDPTSIGDSTFLECSGLTSIVIPDGVTSIGDNAFRDCSELTSITIPDSVTSIGYGAFYDCSELTSIIIPDSVTSISNWTFYNCSKLTSIAIPDLVTSIGDSAFRGCSGVTCVTIGNSVTSIGLNAFYLCSGLTSVTINSDSIVSKTYQTEASIENIFGAQVTEYIIGNDVTSIGKDAFYGCSGLTSVTIGNSVTSIGYGAFANCSGLTRIIIGNSVTSIGNWTFYNCSRLTSIAIPDLVISIGDSVFVGCSGLTSIICNATTAPTISSNSFERIKSGGTLTVPAGSTGYDVWMGTGSYYLGYYNWTKVEQ